MRIFLLLVVALVLAGLFAFFPEVADATLRIEAFGWVFESRQGPFILLLVALLAVLWLVRRFFASLVAGPGQLWHALKSGSKQRKQAELRDGLAEWLDMRGEQGWKHFRKARGLLPDWADAILERLPNSPAELPLPREADDDLLVAATARMATDPQARPRPDIARRKAHLDAWLKVHPDAPLALERKADLLEEEGKWREFADMLEKIWRRGGSSAARTAPRLAEAYLHLAECDAEHTLEYLRKAHRMQPESQAVNLALGRALRDADEKSACRKLWLAHLESQNNMQAALELTDLLRDDALAAYRKLEKRRDADMTPALRLLRAGLAHAAGLSGLAREQMDALLAEHPSPQAWRMLGDWQRAEKDWQRAAESYRQAGLGEDV